VEKTQQNRDARPKDLRQLRHEHIPSHELLHRHQLLPAYPEVADDGNRADPQAGETRHRPDARQPRGAVVFEGDPQLRSEGHAASHGGHRELKVAVGGQKRRQQRAPQQQQIRQRRQRQQQPPLKERHQNAGARRDGVAAPGGRKSKNKLRLPRETQHKEQHRRDHLDHGNPGQHGASWDEIEHGRPHQVFADHRRTEQHQRQHGERPHAIAKQHPRTAARARSPRQIGEYHRQPHRRDVRAKDGVDGDLAKRQQLAAVVVAGGEKRPLAVVQRFNGHDAGDGLVGLEPEPAAAEQIHTKRGAGRHQYPKNPPVAPGQTVRRFGSGRRIRWRVRGLAQDVITAFNTLP